MCSCFFFGTRLSVPLQTKLQCLGFKMQTMCGMSVWTKTQVNAFVGWQGERGRKVFKQSLFRGGNLEIFLEYVHTEKEDVF